MIVSRVIVILTCNRIETVPACNALSRDAELDNVAKWAVTNNLQLNRAMSVEGHDNIQRPITRKRYKIEL